MTQPPAPKLSLRSETDIKTIVRICIDLGLARIITVLFDVHKEYVDNEMAITARRRSDMSEEEYSKLMHLLSQDKLMNELLKSHWENQLNKAISEKNDEEQANLVPSSPDHVA